MDDTRLQTIETNCPDNWKNRCISCKTINKITKQCSNRRSKNYGKQIENARRTTCDCWR